MKKHLLLLLIAFSIGLITIVLFLRYGQPAPDSKEMAKMKSLVKELRLPKPDSLEIKDKGAYKDWEGASQFSRYIHMDYATTHLSQSSLHRKLESTGHWIKVPTDSNGEYTYIEYTNQRTGITLSDFVIPARMSETKESELSICVRAAEDTGACLF